jgi:hypothetical protein
VIGRIESRAFKNDAYRRVNFVQGFFIALRAACQGLIGEFLLALEL